MSTDQVIEQWVKDEWREGVSAGAAARQVCRWLGCSDAAPTLKRLLEELLADANRDDHDRACILNDFREAAPDAARIATLESFERAKRRAA